MFTSLYRLAAAYVEEMEASIDAKTAEVKSRIPQELSEKSSEESNAMPKGDTKE